MADNILRLRVQSDEYDAKLKKAAEGIRHLAEVAHQGGGELTGLEKSELDYVKALGEMDTKSRTAAGSVRELESTYKELKVIYDQLNEVEKADEGGKALAASLETLKQRAQEAKAQLDTATSSLNDNGEAGKGTSSVMDVLKDKFTVNIDAIKLLNIGLKAAEGALNVAKDAFGANEAAVDEWGRIVDSSRSLYEGFLNSINTGDISGFLSRIDQIVQAARTAYDELDRLGTMKTIQAPQISAQQTENDRLRMMIQTRRYIAPVDGRRSAMQNGQLLTPAQINRLEQQLQNGLQKVTSLVGNEVKQTSRAIDAVYRRQGAELGMSVKEFRKGTSSMAEFDKRIEGAANYQKWQREHSYVDQQSGRLIAPRTGNPYQQYKGWDVFRVDGERYNKLVQLIQQRDQQSAQAYSTQSQAYRTINRAEGISARGTSTTPKTTNKNTGAHTTIEKTEMQINSEQIQKLTQEYIAASAERRQAIQQEIKVLQDRNKEIQNLMNEAQGKTSPTQKLTQQNIADINKSGSILGDDFMKVTSVDYKAPIEAMNSELERFIALRDKATTPEEWQRLNEAINGVQKGKDEFMGKSAKDSNNTDAMEDLSKGISGLTTIIGGLQKIGIQLPDEVQMLVGAIEGVMAIIQGVNTVLSVTNATAQAGNTVAVTANTAAATANTATMAALITALQINTATGMIPFFAGGGVIGKAAGGMLIPGSSFSGDNLRMPVDWGRGMIGVNSGELILNAAQQNNVAGKLQGAGAGNIHVTGELQGEKIYLATNRYLRRSGKGELVTWK